MKIITPDILAVAISTITRALPSYAYVSVDDDLEVTRSKYHVHWNSIGKLQHITWRLDDSLPQEKITELQGLIQQFNQNHPQPWNTKTLVAYRNLIGPKQEILLDKGYGSCILRFKSIRSQVEKVIDSIPITKADVIAYVIMPNHVHLLLRQLTDIDSLMHFIKGESAIYINRCDGKNGIVWRKSYFDRMIRSERQLISTIMYMVRNPRYLGADEYTLWVKGIGTFCCTRELLDFE